MGGAGPWREGWRGRASASRRQTGSRGPSWQAAYSHTWLNRDNGGCPSKPASFPQAEPQVPECPEPPPETSWEAARGQHRGTSQEGQQSPLSAAGRGWVWKGPWCPSWGMQLYGVGCAGGARLLPGPHSSQTSSPKRASRGCNMASCPSASPKSEPGGPPSLLWENKGPLFPGLPTELWRPNPMALTDHQWLCSND